MRNAGRTFERIRRLKFQSVMSSIWSQGWEMKLMVNLIKPNEEMQHQTSYKANKIETKFPALSG